MEIPILPPLFRSYALYIFQNNSSDAIAAATIDKLPKWIQQFCTKEAVASNKSLGSGV